MGSSSLYSYLLLSLFTIQALCQTPSPCCEVKTVTNAPAGNENLNGEYLLKDTADDKPHENCADGCVYTKDGEEYCFMNVPVDQAAEISCDIPSGGPEGEATSPQAGPTGTGAGETAGPGEPSAGPGTGASTGAGTAGPGTDAGTEAPTGGQGTGEGGQGTGEGTGVPGATTAQGAEATTAGDPSSRGQAAQEEKEKATEEKEEAEATVAAAQETAEQAKEVEKKIDDVVAEASSSSATTPAGGRVRRQATTGIPTFTVPSTCASFQSMVSDMNAQIALKTVIGLQTATNIGTALVKVVPETISCSAEDV